jgi:hypothetical protein
MSIGERTLAAFCFGVAAGAAIMDIVELILKSIK